MTRALLIQALDALETCDTSIKQLMAQRGVLVTVTPADAASDAIRAHLAQPQGEPVAFIDRHPHPWSHTLGTQQSLRWTADECSEATPLFTHPAHTEAEVQEILDASYREAGALEPVVRHILKVSKP